MIVDLTSLAQCPSDNVADKLFGSDQIIRTPYHCPHHLPSFEPPRQLQLPKQQQALTTIPAIGTPLKSEETVGELEIVEAGITLITSEIVSPVRNPPSCSCSTFTCKRCG
jgi:hypothetical protein